LVPLASLVPWTLQACGSDDGINPLPKSDAASSSESSTEGGGGEGGASGLMAINHFVVIYMENHSFDNLYGEFPNAEGIAAAMNAQQVDGDGGAYPMLPMPAGFPEAGLPNAPFAIEDYVPANMDTVDLHHIFFTEQRQINGGAMNKYTYWSDALGLTQGHYHTLSLPVPKEAQNWTVCDHFHHAAFGGSFLNHHWLIAAATPIWDQNAKAVPMTSVQDPQALVPGAAEKGLWLDNGNYYVINTSFSVNQPLPNFNPPAAGLVPNLKNPTIGDRLSAANLDWAWYSGGWNDAVQFSANGTVTDGGVSPVVSKFQYHHQPFIYYEPYSDGKPGRSHLKDEKDFLAAAQSGMLPPVSFVKPVGIDNEHPGYTDVLDGENHLMALINAVKNSPSFKDTMLIVTYDEHGGFWDHVAPPAGDKWGPGSRVPTIVISPFGKKNFVDHTVYDTTSIAATIEKRFGLMPLSDRDKNAKTLEATLAP
jgi:phospholipase C